MESLKLSITLPVEPEKLYNDWLDSKLHTAFTGSKARVSSKANGRFTAWDGYIKGKNLELIAGKKIVQSWRTNDFDEDAPDSILELTFERKGKGTKLTLFHHDLQKDDAKKYKQGWRDFYLLPIKHYYEKFARENAESEKPAAKKKTKKDSASGSRSRRTSGRNVEA